MPELPEVETVTRELQPRLTNATIKQITVHWPRTVYEDEQNIKKTLEGQTITQIHRRGKYICFHCGDGSRFTLHLRMTGKCLFKLTPKEEKHLRVTFRFAEDFSLYFVDMRKFGRIKLWPAGGPLLPELGPEPLDAADVLRALENTRSTRPIKTVLLDQGFLAGIGNIYADEALHRVGVHPLTEARRLTPAQRQGLSTIIPEILLAAIQNRGTTISQYRRTDDSTGENQMHLKVYQRTHQACLGCGGVIQRRVVNGRSSHFCPVCQTLPPTLPVSDDR